MEPEPPKKRLWLKIGVPVAVGIVVAVASVVMASTSASKAEEGDCLDVPEFTSDVQLTKIDCADKKANVRVAVKLDGENETCPEGDYDHLSFDGGPTLCLVLNAKDGECFANVTSTTEGYERVACDDPSAEIRVVKVVEGTADPQDACAETEAVQGVVYSKPPTVLCIGPPTVA